MQDTPRTPAGTPPHPEHFDFLIIGAGISGIGAARYLRQRFPNDSLAILETMDGYGGTWWTHRYPGARSDSDLYTYGYAFKPWKGNTIASAEEIRRYLGEAIEEGQLDARIRYGHQVTAADWSSQEQRWTLQVTRLASGEQFTVTAGFLWMCAGYYDHRKGHMPEWPGMQDFQGRTVHPQHWPEDLDYAGKRVVVIGSGATAATLVPALADQVAHITMLQRSPTFFASDPVEHPLEAPLRALNLPDDWMHEIMRRAHIAKTEQVVRMSAAQPDAIRTFLIDQARAQLPQGFDVDKHFNPSYRPWQQRIAVIPDGDLFTAIRSGKASVVTDTIERFDATGIQLTSGEHLDADIIVTATGFNMLQFGGIPLRVDGVQVPLQQRATYRGLMMEGIPNMAYLAGYFRFSWTLRVDLVCDLVCRMIEHMRAQGLAVVVPTPADIDMPREPWNDADNINAGYIMRAREQMPRQGPEQPWRHAMEYYEERDVLPGVSPADKTLRYG